ncbi:MAG TPA: Uma2 family endonuclease [Isosphaeraceae bacterium]|nr:Uma2 family endonuclease [Isosphaeraceae bacterium]
MTTITEKTSSTETVRRERLSPESLDHAVTLRDLTWSDFEAITTIKGDRGRPRLIYNQGSLTLVSPSQAHEEGIDLIDTLIKEICVGLRIPYKAIRQTLLRRQDLDRGIEGDGTYYITNEPVVRSITRIDLDTEPPPDLAVESEITHPATEALAVWQHFGVPEVWVFNGRKKSLTIRLLDDKRVYVESQTSRSFPFLSVQEILAWVIETKDESQTDWQIRLRDWVRDELSKRVK